MTDSLAQLRTAGVDLGGLMTVLGRHLYSTPFVALRELVQNAHDSITRRRIEDPDWAGASRITVSADLKANIVRVTDTGAGLTEDEVHRYLATVGVGYTRQLRQGGHDAEGLIGMFGLGFLSAFVLAERVTVTTTSYQQPDRGWRYQSSTGEKYTLTEVPAREVGTVVELELRDAYSQLAGEGYLSRVLMRYCALLREPIHIGTSDEPVNAIAPPWRHVEGAPIEHPVAARKRDLAFAARFETDFEPICCIPVGGAEKSDVRGMLWIQDGGTYGHSDNRNLSVFVRGMLLDDDARDLLPAWAGYIGGVIESDGLTPTASREDLQRDDAYRHAQRALAEALVEGLAALPRTQPDAWRRVLRRHNEALLGAALSDARLFDLVADDVRIPTSHGDMKASALASNKGVHVSLGGEGGFEEMLFRALRVPVARGDRYAVLPFLREWVKRHGGRLIEIGTEQGNRQLFSDAPVPADVLTWLQAGLADNETVVPARFAPAELPLVVVPDRDAELKRVLEDDAADKRISMSALRLVRGFTAGIDGSVRARLYVNLDNPAVKALLDTHATGGDTRAALRLLKAMKVLMAAGTEQDGSLDLNAALGDVGHSVLALLRPATIDADQ
ncbi:molecular chaperone HtpG [Luteibacter sp. Sphag1AF]|uniref:ATP-binding protein n=1 Tax=Luteibacter sp. Sphag1AF TaxID=2587031 RepID=UPI00161A7716|nr:ATP-binding protein [Luteibacter sp. Sphag1AF]MBB3228809.1 molecular chaperone HtpG [Luteibacter sp. Sphag1AF]